MFSFFTRQKLSKVRAILEGRVNRSHVRHLNDGDRHGARGALCEVAFLVPYRGDRRPDFANVRAVWTRDMSWAGLSILDDTLIDAESVLIALESDSEYKFLHSLVEHCSHLGYGHFQIGLQPTELVDLATSDRRAFEQALGKLATDSCSETIVARPAHANA